MGGVRARIFSIVGLSLVFTIFISTDCFPWGGGVHRYMSEEAAMVMPEYIRRILNIHMYSLKEGTLDPDMKRLEDHQNVAQCAGMIGSYAKKAEKMIKKGRDWEKIAFTLGQAAHYIQDLNQPQHCSTYETPDEHKSFEHLAVYGHWQREMYDGFHYIKNYRKFASNTARFSVRYVKYTTRSDLLRDYEFYCKFITPIWAHAVNDTADLWLAIFRNGLSEEKYKELSLPETVGVRGHKRIKYPKIKDL